MKKVEYLKFKADNSNPTEPKKSTLINLLLQREFVGYKKYGVLFYIQKQNHFLIIDLQLEFD